MLLRRRVIPTARPSGSLTPVLTCLPTRSVCVEARNVTVRGGLLQTLESGVHCRGSREFSRLSVRYREIQEYAKWHNECR